jgi:hypothetical protein
MVKSQTYRMETGLKAVIHVGILVYTVVPAEQSNAYVIAAVQGQHKDSGGQLKHAYTPE